MSQSQNASIALMQLEQSLNNFQNYMLDEEGKLQIGKEWFAIYDDLLTKIIDAREMADTVNREKLTHIEWKTVNETIKALK